MMLTPYYRSFTDKAGNRLRNVLCTVTYFGIAAAMFSDAYATVPIVSNVVTTGEHGEIFFFAAPGQYKLSISDPTGKVAAYEMFDALPSIVDEARQFSRYSPDGYPDLPNDIAKLDAACNFATMTGGTVFIPAKTFKVPRTWSIPNNVCVDGVHYALSIIKRTADPDDGTVEYGPTAWSYPVAGVTTAIGGKSLIRNVQFDGNGIGVNNIEGDTTATSPVITNVVTTGVLAGYKLEGEGVPAGSKVLSVTSSTITLDNPIVFTKASQKLWWRKAWTVIATATLDDKVLQVTSGDMSKIAKGLKGEGTKLDTDEDLSSSTRVMAVDQAAQTITMDRPPKSAGSFAFTAYEANDVFLVPEYFYNPGADEDREYRAPTFDGCVMTGGSGGGLICRPTRDQIILQGACKITANFGRGFSATGVNDLKLLGACGFGSNAEGNVIITTGGTPRVENFDAYDCKQSDKYADVRFRGCRHGTISHFDINGWMEIIGKGIDDEENHGLKIAFGNFKWHANSELPSGGFNQFIKIRGDAQVHATNMNYYRDRQTDTTPDYVFYIEDGSTLIHDRMWMVFDTANVNCPFEVALVDPAGHGDLIAELVDSETGLVVKTYDNKPVADGSDARNIGVGAYVSDKLGPSEAIAVANNTVVNLKSITVKPGDWEEGGQATFVGAGVAVTSLWVGLGSAANDMPTTPEKHAAFDLGFTLTGQMTVHLPKSRIKPTVDTLQYLNVKALTAGGLTAFGFVHARCLR